MTSLADASLRGMASDTADDRSGELVRMSDAGPR